MYSRRLQQNKAMWETSSIAKIKKAKEKSHELINTFATGDTEKAASLLAEGDIQHNLAYGTGRGAFNFFLIGTAVVLFCYGFSLSKIGKNNGGWFEEALNSCDEDS